MTFHEFSEMNLRRCEAQNGFNHKLSSWSLSDWFTAILGELGEAANVAKKLNRVRDGIPGNKETADDLRQKLKSELADTFIYLDLLSQAAGFEIGDVVLETFDAKSRQIGYIEIQRRRRRSAAGRFADGSKGWSSARRPTRIDRRNVWNG